MSYEDRAKRPDSTPSETQSAPKQAPSAPAPRQSPARLQADEVRREMSRSDRTPAEPTVGKALTGGKLDITKVDPYSYASWVLTVLRKTAVWQEDAQGKRVPLWQIQLNQLKQQKTPAWSRPGMCPGNWDGEAQDCDIHAVMRQLDACLVEVTADGAVVGIRAPTPGPIRGARVILPNGVALAPAEYEAERARLKARWALPY